MKTIKKTSWQYKFLIWTFQYEPKNLCALHLYTLAAFILSPLVLFENYLNYFFDFIDKTQEKSMSKNHSEVWLNRVLGLMVCFFLSMFFILFNIGILWMFGLHKEITTVTSIFVLSGSFWGPALYAGIRKSYKIGKEKFCKPITYTE